MSQRQTLVRDKRRGPGYFIVRGQGETARLDPQDRHLSELPRRHDGRHPDDNVAAKPVACITCHERQTASYGASKHGLAMKAGDASAPTCKDCHDSARGSAAERAGVTAAFQGPHKDLRRLSRHGGGGGAGERSWKGCRRRDVQSRPHALTVISSIRSSSSARTRRSRFPWMCAANATRPSASTPSSTCPRTACRRFLRAITASRRNTVPRSSRTAPVATATISCCLRRIRARRFTRPTCWPPAASVIRAPRRILPSAKSTLPPRKHPPKPWASGAR